MSKYDDIDTHYSRSEVRKVRRLEEPQGSWWPWGILPWLGLLALATYSCSAIQEKTESVVERELAAKNLGWAEANASGRTITLTGTPPSTAAAKRAERVALDAAEKNWLGITFDPVKVRSDFDLPAPPPPPETPPADTPAPSSSADWNFVLANNVLTLKGEVPDEATRLEIIKVAQARGVTEDQLVVLNERPPEGYQNVAVAGANAISKCDEGIVSFRAKVLSLDCELPRSSEASIRNELTSAMSYGRLGNVRLIATEDITACESALSTLLTNSKIRFATGSAKINQTSQDQIKRISEAAQGCPGTLRIEGHTDNTGSNEKNIELSGQRAEAVRAALVSNGIEANRLVARGFGSSQPAASNATAEGRTRNRRIEIKVVGPNE